MELEARSKGSELGFAREMQIAQRPEQHAEMSGAEMLAWSQAWLEAWPQAKTVAMGEKVKVAQFEQPGTWMWTRAEAAAWVKAELMAAKAEAAAAATRAEMWAKVTALMEGKKDGVNEAAALASDMWKQGKEQRKMWSETRAEAKAKAEAEALAEVWAASVRGEPQMGDNVPSMPSGLADSSTRDILASLNRYGVANALWHYSPETRDEYSCIIHFIAPITRLPFELLLQIFLIIIDGTRGPPSALMLVCKRWHAIVTSIWASLNLGTTTPIDAVQSKLERSQWLLDIVVDTDSDRGDFTPSDSAFEAIFAAIEATPRWRSLVVESFPARADLPEDLVNRHLQQSSDATMSRFTTFRIKSACETSPLLDGLLRILGTRASSELTTVEANSENVISFLTSLYPSIFHSVKVLSLDALGMRDPVDLLPHLHQLESFTASHLHLPTYHNDTDLPFVHRLRHLRLKSVSIQWMSGRTFDALENCTLIFPHCQQVLPVFSTTLPNCNHLTFRGYPLEILGGISSHKLSHLSVACSGSFNRRGSRQLVWLSQVAKDQLAPKILHISTAATSEAWINALDLMSDLEELVVHNAQPSSLGAKVFQSLTFHSGHASNLGVTSAPGEVVAPLCPSLRRFGLKYDRWLRRSERFDLIPVFMSIIRTRQHSNHSLESFSLWTTTHQKDPLELIERSQISVEGFKRLAKESGIEEHVLDFETAPYPYSVIEAQFRNASWRLADEMEPKDPATGRSLLHVLLEEFTNEREGRTYKCRLCNEPFSRSDRAITHLRHKHLDHRPLWCEGSCGIKGWCEAFLYVFLDVPDALCSRQRFHSRDNLSAHAKPNLVSCPYWLVLAAQDTCATSEMIFQLIAHISVFVRI